MDNILDTAGMLKIDLFKAYYDARRHKRNTVNQLKFEVNFERELLLLYDEIINRNYKPRPSICFIVDVPVKREVFAADFRDRVIHHLLCGYINPIFEDLFIEDSYSCRKGKGTLYGIQRVDGFIRECSENYTCDCHILKLDIRGYFMNIDKNILASQLEELLTEDRIHKAYGDNPQPDWEIVRYLIKEIIYQDVKQDCIIKGINSDWNGLPRSKSLFHVPAGKGLPIGNLTSQLFSNVYMHIFDSFISSYPGIEYYGRYVDDFVIVHQDKDFLKKLIPQIRDFLAANLCLEIHPNKIYLQHYTKGVTFLGAVIKPNRTYAANRTVSHFKKALHTYNRRLRNEEPPSKDELLKMRATVNSYLGVMRHFKTYNLKKKILLGKPNELFRYGYFTAHLNNYKLHGKTKKEITTTDIPFPVPVPQYSEEESKDNDASNKIENVENIYNAQNNYAF